MERAVPWQALRTRYGGGGRDGARLQVAPLAFLLFLLCVGDVGDYVGSANLVGSAEGGRLVG